MTLRLSLIVRGLCTCLVLAVRRLSSGIAVRCTDRVGDQGGKFTRVLTILSAYLMFRSGDSTNRAGEGSRLDGTTNVIPNLAFSLGVLRQARARLGHAAMTREAQSSIRGTRWTVRLIPFFLAAAFGAATYIVPAHLCGKSSLPR